MNFRFDKIKKSLVPHWFEQVGLFFYIWTCPNDKILSRIMRIENVESYKQLYNLYWEHEHLHGDRTLQYTFSVIESFNMFARMSSRMIWTHLYAKNDIILYRLTIYNRLLPMHSGAKKCIGQFNFQSIIFFRFATFFFVN